MTSNEYRGSLTRQTGNAPAPLWRPCVQWQVGTAPFERRSTQQAATQNATQRHKPSRETLAAFARQLSLGLRRNATGAGSLDLETDQCSPVDDDAS